MVFFIFHSVKIQGIQLFIDHLVVYERKAGLPKITTYRLPAVGEALKSLQGGKSVAFIDPICSIDPEESLFSSSILRFSYSSLRTPPSVYDYDMNTEVSVLKKIRTVRHVKKIKKLSGHIKFELLFVIIFSKENFMNTQLLGFLIYAFVKFYLVHGNESRSEELHFYSVLHLNYVLRSSG